MINVLFIAAEAAPLAKAGGLGDVIGALPRALNNKTLEVRVLLPRYGDLADNLAAQAQRVDEFVVPLGWRRHSCTIDRLEAGGITFYLLGSDYYFNRQGIYGFNDDHERFAFLCRAALEALPRLSFRPDILHCHDWHTGMVCALLAAHYRNHSFYRDMKTVFTIHNLEYQGNVEPAVAAELFDLPDSWFTPDTLEFNGKASFIKGGLVFADRLTTVSPAYAAQVVTAGQGFGLEELLAGRGNNFSGIANGIDYTRYNPAKDDAVGVPFDGRALRRRRQNKLRLQTMLGLDVAAGTPLIGMVSRLVPSKGFDLLIEAWDELLLRDMQLVVLGTGEARYEAFFHRATRRHARRAAVCLDFDEKLAHRIYAGSDLFLMPSLYEPCGVAQLIAMRYGSVPVVHSTGGLKDTVAPYDSTTGQGTGFVFHSYTAADLVAAMDEALALYRNHKAWTKLVRNAMRQDNSWRQAAGQYQAVYESLMAE